MRVEEARELLLRDHDDTPYMTAWEDGETLQLFWGKDSLFRPLFDYLDLTDVLELACGRGRHSLQFVDRAKRLTLVDPVASNIEACRARFEPWPYVECRINNGVDLSDLASSRFSGLFCYDAMVHFEATDVIGYVHEIARVLRPGGRALLHYSNNERFPTGTYRDDEPRWRNFFSQNMMMHFASRAGLHILRTVTFPWMASEPDPADEDGLILLEKPSSAGCAPLSLPSATRAFLLDAANDAEAAAAGVPHLGLYRTGSEVRIRLQP